MTRVYTQYIDTIYTCTTFIRSTLDYGDCLFDNCSITDCRKLEDVQLYAARIVTGAKRYTSHGAIYNEIGWSTLQKRRDAHKLTHFYKICHNLTPLYLSELLPPDVSTRIRNRYPLRNNFNYTPFRWHHTFFRDSFLPSTLLKWNDLPPDVRSVPSLEQFKNYVNAPLKYTTPYYYNCIPRPTAVILSQMWVDFSNLNSHLYSKNLLSTKSKIHNLKLLWNKFQYSFFQWSVYFKHWHIRNSICASYNTIILGRNTRSSSSVGFLLTSVGSNHPPIHLLSKNKLSHQSCDIKKSLKLFSHPPQR